MWDLVFGIVSYCIGRSVVIRVAIFILGSEILSTSLMAGGMSVD